MFLIIKFEEDADTPSITWFKIECMDKAAHLDYKNFGVGVGRCYMMLHASRIGHSLTFHVYGYI